ncbi:MAG: type II toxin-antitoxin system HicA family toxin [Gammaproteobacteria bacterium]
MRLSRNLSGADFIKRLERLWYRVTRQTGSHIRLTCDQPETHHITVPNHDALRIGTLAAIVADVGAHHHLDRDDLVNKLFG